MEEDRLDLIVYKGITAEAALGMVVESPQRAEEMRGETRTCNVQPGTSADGSGCTLIRLQALRSWPVSASIPNAKHFLFKHYLYNHKPSTSITMNYEPPPATPTIFLQLTSYNKCNIQIVMKTMPFHRFWLDVLKKTKLEAIINWFNH